MLGIKGKESLTKSLKNPRLIFHSAPLTLEATSATRVESGMALNRRRAGCHESVLCSLRMRPVNGFESLLDCGPDRPSADNNNSHYSLLFLINRTQCKFVDITPSAKFCKILLSVCSKGPLCYSGSGFQEPQD